MTRSLDVTPKTTLRSGKSEAYNKRLRTSYYFVEANYTKHRAVYLQEQSYIYILIACTFMAC